MHALQRLRFVAERYTLRDLSISPSGISFLGTHVAADVQSITRMDLFTGPSLVSLFGARLPVSF